jgi:hypothetical protein
MTEMVSFSKARVCVVFLVERAAIIDSQSFPIPGRACRSTSQLHSSTTRPALVHRLCMSASGLHRRCRVPASVCSTMNRLGPHPPRALRMQPSSSIIPSTAMSPSCSTYSPLPRFVLSHDCLYTSPPINLLSSYPSKPFPLITRITSTLEPALRRPAAAEAAVFPSLF